MNMFKKLTCAVLMAASLAGQASAQSQNDNEPCPACGVIIIGGGLLALAVLEAVLGGGSSSSSNDKDCNGRLIPSPEGGPMPADPDCR